jgi:hypothetical protein
VCACEHALVELHNTTRWQTVIAPQLRLVVLLDCSTSLFIVVQILVSVVSVCYSRPAWAPRCLAGVMRSTLCALL